MGRQERPRRSRKEEARSPQIIFMSKLRPSLDWLLIFVPITVALEYLLPHAEIWIFAASCAAIIPVAGWLGKATEHLAERTNETLGGLLNATFGNAAELIIAIVALNRGLHDVVKASLTGSIIGNVLLVLGAAMLAGGVKHKVQKFNAVAAQTQSTMLLLAAIAMVVPAAFHYLTGGHARLREDDLSTEISIVLLVCYGLSLLFVLHTHKKLFSSERSDKVGNGAPCWSVSKALVVLAVATVAIAWMSEILVGSVQAAATSLGMTRLFVGVIVVAIVGNAAEHSTAVMVAMKDRMDLSLGVSVGSSLQIALFVAPLVVIVSHFTGPRPMNLVFSPAEVMAIVLSVLLVSQISDDGESHWLEGAQLLAVYIILGIVFYFLPEAPA
jgi:Ca2+:H+ antiporter